MRRRVEDGAEEGRIDASIDGEGGGSVGRVTKGDPRVLQIFLADRLSNRPVRCAVEFRQGAHQNAKRGAS